MTKPNISYNNGDVVVEDKKGTEIFRMPKTPQTVAIASAIYMYEKYNYRKEQV